MGTVQNDTEGKSFMLLWPPSEHTRSLMVQHMIICLSSESVFSRHGLFSKVKVAEHAKEIEDIAFAVANHRASIFLNVVGSSIARFYAKETSRLLLYALEEGIPAETKHPNIREAFSHEALQFIRSTRESLMSEMKESVFDISTGEREFLDRHSARKLFRPLEEHGNSYTKICISNKSFGVSAARVARIVLRGVRETLKDVELKDFYFERSEANACKVMTIFSSAFRHCVLRSLSLELVEHAEKGHRAFGYLLKSQEMLEELKFRYTHISVEWARAICESLPSVERIKCLHFSVNASNNDATQTLSMLVEKCTALEDFEFSGSGASTQGAVALVRALSQGSRLKKLNLKSNSKFRANCGVALSKVIPRHLDLTEVYFDAMNLEDKGTIAIANSLKDAAPSLRVLTVRDNFITSKAAPALANCLAVKKLLTVFHVGDNMLRDEGSVVICKAILDGHEFLKELELCHNSMTDIGALAAAEAVANKPDSSRLFISENFVSRKGIEIVRDMLRKGTKGDYVLAEMYELDLFGNIPLNRREFGKRQ